MKVTVIVPIYNAENYLHRCVDSLLSQTIDDYEIILINDGSTDRTSRICDDYLNVSTKIRVYHKLNEGVSKTRQLGVELANGDYLIHVDPDDWVDSDVLIKILNFLRGLVASNINLDLLISNYVYDKVGEEKKKVVNYKKALPEGRIFTWNEIGRFKYSQNFLMHSVI